MAAGLTDEEQRGTWHTVRADFPEHAFAHVRGLSDSSHHARTGDCRSCPAHHIGSGSGSHEQALRAAEDAIGMVTPRRPPAVRIPDSFFWPHSYKDRQKTYRMRMVHGVRRPPADVRRCWAESAACSGTPAEPNRGLCHYEWRS
ncbi:hypothetical protein ACH419_32765 [Streptomyces bobili]|uniref:hypothetical protein n=1 Tax=Streptomyces bobili TaxID=67280 RepID=UPI0037962077